MVDHGAGAPMNSPRRRGDLSGFEIRRQPDDETCGPTCLHAVYQYFGDELPLDDVTAEVPRLVRGGTLAVSLANHALRRGYRALIYTYNLSVFDPTWFGRRTPDLIERLRAQARRISRHAFCPPNPNEQLRAEVILVSRACKGT